ncbi:MAG: helix-turn-helix transcriptional regulator [Lentisphaeraceae bacterium]|nr:helix-turn-helix transcriptional regulator [Lentisphaeraceae bacterium]
MAVKVTEDLSKSVNDWLIDKDLTFREAAKIVGCSPSTLEKIKNRKIKTTSDRTISKLEQYINCYRDVSEFQSYIKSELEHIGGFDPETWKWSTDIIEGLREYKHDKQISYEEMSKKYKFPLIKLVKYMESEYEGDLFRVDFEDIPGFIAMVFQVSSDNKNGR